MTSVSRLMDSCGGVAGIVTPRPRGCGARAQTSGNPRTRCRGGQTSPTRAAKSPVRAERPRRSPRPSEASTGRPAMGGWEDLVSGFQETLQVGALKVRFVVEPEDSNGSVSVFECFVPAQATMPAPHSHDAFEETVYGLEGVSTWTVDGQVHEIGVGDAVCVARGAVHGFDNRGAQDAKFLAI